MVNFDLLQEELKQLGQEHLLKFWDTITPQQQRDLYNEIKSIDVTDSVELFKKTTLLQNEDPVEKLDSLLQPIPPDSIGSVTRTSPEKLKEYRNLGLKAISEGKAAVLLLAGGQGTRLGVPYPKGMYDVGLPSKKTLYQLQAERILRLQQLARQEYSDAGNCLIPWYIMTSEYTREQTVEFFAAHDYFGLKKDQILVFEQFVLPCFTFDGKIILQDSHSISKAPNGNGGLYSALRRRKIINDMVDKGIEHIHVYCVDNILVKMADPTFIGYCISLDSDCGAKVVKKDRPTEAVGVVCKVDGVYKVVEYSELSLTTAKKRDEDGQLTFSAGNICNHYFRIDFLQKISLEENDRKLCHHVAKKKIPYVADNGSTVKPTKPNGIKMEKFVFDVFEFSNKFCAWEVLREDEFSPLKNADGAEKDTPTTARDSLYCLHRRYVIAAGGEFIDEEGAVIPLIPSQRSCSVYESPVICEISSLVSYDGEELEDRVSGKQFTVPCIID